MSRVIKAARWQEEPRVIVPPGSKHKNMSATETEADKEEDINRRLAVLKEKEDKAQNILQEARVEADIIRQEAETYREKLLREAQEEIAKLREDTLAAAQAEGFAAGKREGEGQIREEMAETIKSTNAKAEHILKTAENATKDYLVQADHAVAEVAMAIAEKVLPQHFIDVPQVVLPLVRDALQKVADQKQIVIHVAPEHYEFVLMARDEFRSMLPGGNANLTVHSDDSLKPGDCLIETESGSVDARLATQLELIKEALQAKLM